MPLEGLGGLKSYLKNYAKEESRPENLFRSGFFYGFS